jgi:hypothetical protein
LPTIKNARVAPRTYKGKARFRQVRTPENIFDGVSISTAAVRRSSKRSIAYGTPSPRAVQSNLSKEPLYARHGHRQSQQ